MGAYKMLKNASLEVDLKFDFQDQGWVVSESIAYHSGCNSGYIDKRFDLSAYNQWTFEYEILSLTSGTIQTVVDGDLGVVRNAPGIYKDTFNVTGSNILVQFFSTGINSVRTLKIYPAAAVSNAKTLAFDEGANRFMTYYGWHPEKMHKHKSLFFSFKDGEPWMHNVNPIRNNFYGEQQSSIITFYVNSDHRWFKTFYSMIVNSNSVWFCKNKGDIKTFPSEGKASGMVSRLTANNFKPNQGKWYADILRNMTDPRFTDELQALWNGSSMQGTVMEITIENTSTEEVRLISVDVTYTRQNLT